MLLGKMKAHRPAVPAPTALRPCEEVERAFDVDLVRELGVALAAGGEQRGEVEDDLDLVVRRDLVEQVAVHDVAGVGGVAARAQLGRWRA
jgi:hypothetical protein